MMQLFFTQHCYNSISTYVGTPTSSPRQPQRMVGSGHTECGRGTSQISNGRFQTIWTKPNLWDNADWCLIFAVLSAWVVIRVRACVGSAGWFMLNLRVLLIWRCACVSAHTLPDFSMAAIKPRVNSWLAGYVPACASTTLSDQTPQSTIY